MHGGPAIYLSRPSEGEHHAGGAFTVARLMRPASVSETLASIVSPQNARGGLRLRDVASHPVNAFSKDQSVRSRKPLARGVRH